jgi:hypothetical protein
MPMQFRQQLVTPEQAQKWLDASAGVVQRNLSVARVQRYAHDMIKGNWLLTHQAIAIDPEGVILDGQHRLAAVILAGTPQRFMVARGSDANTFDVIDTGRARNAADTLRISGLTNVNVKAAIARLVLIYDMIKGTTQGIKMPLTSPDILAVWEGPRRPLLEEAEREASRVAAQMDRLGLKTWAAGLYVVITESDPDPAQRDDFFQRLADGALQPPGSPILSFRRWILANTGSGGAIHTADRPFHFLANGIKTWNDWTAGRDRGIAIYRMGREPMPVVEKPAQPLLPKDDDD